MYVDNTECINGYNVIYLVLEEYILMYVECGVIVVGDKMSEHKVVIVYCRRLITLLMVITFAENSNMQTRKST